MSKTPTLFLLLLTTAGCVLPSEPRSPARVEREWGFAGGTNESEALELAALVERVLPYFRTFAGFDERPLRIHQADHVGPEKALGITVEPALGTAWVAVRRGGPHLEHTVAHELAHFYFRDLEAMYPSVLQEGMASLLAQLACPEPDTRERRLVVVAASYLDTFTIIVGSAAGKQVLPYLVQPVPSIEEVFEIGWYENFTADPRVNETVYGLGLLMAERIGWDGLVELAQRCQEQGLETVPAELIRSAAGLEPPSQANISRALREAFGGESDHGDGQISITLEG
jgi:hypothetical protein